MRRQPACCSGYVNGLTNGMADGMAEALTRRWPIMVPETNLFSS